MQDKVVIPLTEKRLLNDREMEALYGVSRHTWRWYRGREDGPEYLKLGRTVLYEPKVVEAWLKEHKEKSAPRAQKKEQ